MPERVPLATLLDLLERFDVEIRIARLGGDGGGLCQVRGHRILVLDADADEQTRRQQCVRALAALPEIESAFIPPAVRELLERTPR